MELKSLGCFLCVAIPGGKIPATQFGYDRLHSGPPRRAGQWLLGVIAQQSWEVPLYKLMVINQIEQQAVSWQTPRSMSVPPPPPFPATSCFNSQNYFYFHPSEVLVLRGRGSFWCMWLPRVTNTSLKSCVHMTAEACLQICWLQIGFEECRFVMSYPCGELAGSGATLSVSQPSSQKANGWPGRGRVQEDTDDGCLEAERTKKVVLVLPWGKSEAN